MSITPQTSTTCLTGSAGTTGGWQERRRPLRLERRVEFPDYQATRDYLDLVGQESEASGVFPNIGFGLTYANFTLYADADPESGEDAITQRQRDFALRVDALLTDAAELRAVA